MDGQTDVVSLSHSQILFSSEGIMVLFCKESGVDSINLVRNLPLLGCPKNFVPKNRSPISKIILS